MKNSNSQKVIKGISSQTLVTILLGIVGVLFFSIMSRLLSREEFGLFASVTAVAAIFSNISDGGIGAALIQRKNMTEDFKNTSFTLALICSGIFAFLLAISSGFLAHIIVGEQLHYPLMIMALTVLFQGILSVNFSWMRRHLQFLKIGIIQIVANLIASVISVFMALAGFGVYAILTHVVAGSFLTLFISFFFVNTRFRIQLKRAYIRSILNFGGWLTGSIIIHSISSQIDRLLMSKLISVTALGAYNRPKEFVLQIGTRINGIFDTALFPVLSNIQDQKESLRNAFCRSQYLMNICSMGLAMSFIINSELIIRIFFGEDWIDLKPVFQIISLSLLLNINARLGDCFLRSLGFVRQQFIFRVLELIVDVVCILIGYRYGIIGVAISFLMANIVHIVLKTMFLAWKMQITQKDIVYNVLGGWAYGTYFIPFIFIQYFLLPDSLYADIVSLITFVIIMFLLFIMFPRLIGHQYQNEIYPKIISVFPKFLR